MTSAAPTPPADLPTLCRHAAGQAGFAIGTLLQADNPRDLTDGEAPQLLADALRHTLWAVAESGTLDDPDSQLLGALERYLDGWAG